MREEPTIAPSAAPTKTPMPKPMSVVQNVCHACCATGRANSMSERTMASGPGKMNSETLKAEISTCHTTSVATITPQGAHASMRLALAFMDFRFSAMLLDQPLQDAAHRDARLVARHVALGARVER